MKFLGTTCISISALFMAGCVTRNQEPPQRLPAVSPLPSYSISSQGEIAARPWWESFERPALTSLIEQSLAQNYSLAQSVAVLKQAESLARRTGAGRKPQLNLEGNGSQDWEDGDSQRGSAEAGLALAWEVDVWNRVGSVALADRLEAQARAADVEALQLSLSAAVANSYFGAVAARERLELLNAQVTLDRELERLLQLRLDNGVGTNVDVLQQQVRVAESETLIPVAESQWAVFENRLDVLLGQTPDAKPRVANGESLDFDRALPSIDVPASLLLNRPDLRSAFSELVAADHEIAAAIADRFPNIVLGASLLYSDDSNFTGSVFTLAASFVQPLLDWGARKAEVQRNEALYEQRLAAFTQLFLEAVESVENALVREAKQSEFLQKLAKQQDLLQRTVNAAERRYTQGIDDYQPVISALQELRAVERNMITAKLDLLAIRIELFRAIGGPVRSGRSAALQPAAALQDPQLPVGLSLATRRVSSILQNHHIVGAKLFKQPNKTPTPLPSRVAACCRPQCNPVYQQDAVWTKVQPYYDSTYWTVSKGSAVAG
ncbi:efflux transporter outer membrane subunit [Pelagicoccus sp. NFK12]|uniref:Efflux transporter outer membrane subunit n=1 Tax=Pelagicoccus enzymogenes TaxID=2773457 RepID=A0A927FAU3_9BACT|nr:efflux transporter outer membrane subunit [Pelagicoccus enzymogenes]MBD5780956.1 efflux transporter outer membrane subunit [Pelagicoccus enzymogenes]